MAFFHLSWRKGPGCMSLFLITCCFAAPPATYSPTRIPQKRPISEGVKMSNRPPPPLFYIKVSQVQKLPWFHPTPALGFGPFPPSWKGLVAPLIFHFAHQVEQTPLYSTAGGQRKESNMTLVSTTTPSFPVVSRGFLSLGLAFHKGREVSQGLVLGGREEGAANKDSLNNGSRVGRVSRQSLSTSPSPSQQLIISA